MDKKILECLASLARVDYWSETGTNHCPFCGKSWRDVFGHLTVSHRPDCSVTNAREILEKEEIYV